MIRMLLLLWHLSILRVPLASSMYFVTDAYHSGNNTCEEDQIQLSLIQEVGLCAGDAKSDSGSYQIVDCIETETEVQLTFESYDSPNCPELTTGQPDRHDQYLATEIFSKACDGRTR